MVKLSFFSSSLIGLALQYYYFIQLPGRVATHFNAAGQANCWSPKGNFTIINCAIFLAVALLFAGIPYLLKVVPDYLINTPNRRYWLSPQNKGRFITICSGHFYFFGLMTNGLLLYVFHQVFRFNCGVSNAMASGMVVTMLVFIVGMLAALISLTHRLKNIRKEPLQSLPS